MRHETHRLTLWDFRDTETSHRDIKTIFFDFQKVFFQLFSIKEFVQTHNLACWKPGRHHKDPQSCCTYLCRRTDAGKPFNLEQASEASFTELRRLRVACARRSLERADNEALFCACDCIPRPKKANRIIACNVALLQILFGTREDTNLQTENT